MNQLKSLIETAEAKLSSAVMDIEDLTISKNHKVNIMDVVEEIKIAQKLLTEAMSITSKEHFRVNEY